MQPEVCFPVGYVLLHYSVAVVLAILLQKLRLCRRLPYAHVLQLLIASELLSLLVLQCPSTSRWFIQPIAWYIIWGLCAAAVTLLAVSSTLSWFIAACGGVDIADAAYNCAHAAAAAAAGGALHVGVDVALIRSGAPVALGDRAVWAFDLVPAVVGMVVLWALSGLPWKSARIGLVGLAAFGTEVLLVLLRLNSHSQSVYRYNSQLAILVQLIYFQCVGHLDAPTQKVQQNWISRGWAAAAAAWAARKAARRRAAEAAAAAAAAARAAGSKEDSDAAAAAAAIAAEEGKGAGPGGAVAAGAAAEKSNSTNGAAGPTKAAAEPAAAGTGGKSPPVSSGSNVLTSDASNAQRSEKSASGSHAAKKKKKKQAAEAAAAPQGPPELPPGAVLPPYPAIEDVLTVCRLPALGRLFMMHLGPLTPPGQEEAASSGAFRMPFKSGEADRLWAEHCVTKGLSGIAPEDTRLARSLLGAFPSHYDTSTCLVEPRAPTWGADLASSVGPATPTVHQLLCVVNPVTPLLRWKRPGQSGAGRIGCHPMLLQHPLVDEPSSHAAQATIYTVVINGQARSLWPALARCSPAAVAAATEADGPQDPAAVSGPVILSAPQTNQAVLISQLRAVLPARPLLTGNDFFRRSARRRRSSGIPWTYSGSHTATGDVRRTGGVSLGGLNSKTGDAAGNAAAAAGGAPAAAEPSSSAAGPLPACLQGVELPKQVVSDLQQLMEDMQSGGVDIVLVPRASLTGETPCGHYIRVWAVAVPLNSGGAGAAEPEISITMTGTGALLSGTHTTAASWARRTSAGATGMSYATATQAGATTRGVSVPTMRMTGDGVIQDPRLRKSRLGPGRPGAGGAGGVGASSSMAGPTPEAALARTQTLLHNNTTNLLHMTLQRNRTAATSLGGAFLLEEVLGAPGSSEATESEPETPTTPTAANDTQDATLGEWPASPAAPSSKLGTDERVQFLDSGSARPAFSHSQSASRNLVSLSGPQLGRRGSNLLSVAGELASGSVFVDDDGMGGISRMSSGVNPVAAVTVERLMSGGTDIFDDEGLADQNEVTTVVYVDEGCPNVLEAVVHSWLSLRGHTMATCRLAEAWVTLRAQAARGRAPDDALLVSECQAADIRYNTASELLEMSAWAAAQEVAVGGTHGLNATKVAAALIKQQQKQQGRQGGSKGNQPSPLRGQGQGHRPPMPRQGGGSGSGGAPWASQPSPSQAPQWAGAALVNPMAALSSRLGGQAPRPSPAAAAPHDSGSHVSSSHISSGTATLGRLDSGGPEALAALAARNRGGLPTVVESSSNPSDTSGSAASSGTAGSAFTAGTSQAATAATSVTSAPPALVVNTYRVALDPVQLAQVGRWLLAHVQHGAVDGDWLQATYSLWRQHVRTIMVNSQIRSIIAAANKGSEASEEGEEEEELSTIQEGSEEAAGSSSASSTISTMVTSSMTGTGTCVTALEGVEEDEEDMFSMPPPPSAAVTRRDTQPVLEQLLANTCEWILQHGCVTTGTMSLLRQVQRICLEAAVPALLDAILECAKHKPEEYISDIDLMTVYLEQIGIANEVLQFFGIHKFRLGRILWTRHRAVLPPTRTLAGSAPALPSSTSGSGVGAAGLPVIDGGVLEEVATTASNISMSSAAATDSAAPDGQGMVRGGGKAAAGADATASCKAGLAAAQATADRDILEKPAKGVYDLDADKEAETRAHHAALFVMWVGNGMFWIVPFLLQWVLSRTIGSGLIDNGRLPPAYFEWLVWGFFCGYLIAGGYFNLLMHLQLYHRWRFSMPSMLMAMVQGWCSCLLLFAMSAWLLVAYAVLRFQSWSMAWFSAVTFFLMCMYITQMLMLFCSTTSNSAWAGGPGRTVLLIFTAQAAVNQLSFRTSTNPIAENLVILASFMVIAGIFLWRNLRTIQATWAEALTAPKGAQLSPGALQLLLNFHNATYVTSYTADSPREDLVRACAAASALLVKKLQALRRLRLPLFYDQTAWVWPAGSLTHLLITMPFWTSQLWSDGGWMGTNSIPLVISSMYVMLAGGYLEWLLALMTKGDQRPTPRQQALINAAAAEAAATEALQQQVRGSSSRAGRTAVCGLCGAAGCDSGCNSNMCGYLLAPPGARCIPRGPTYYFGWHIGFTPLKPLDGSGKVHDGGYWKQLYKMLVWHTMMWAFGLMILLLIIAARQPIVVANVPQYAQIFWREISLPISYTMMCVGYSFYLSVGFNHVMGMTLRMRQIVTYMFVGLVVGCLAVIPLSYAPGAMPYIPAISVMFTGFTYWLLAVHTNILEWLAKEGEAVRRRAFVFARINKLEVIQTSGQAAITNSLVDHTEAAGALYRLQNTPGVKPSQVTPASPQGAAVMRVLLQFVGALQKPAPPAPSLALAPAAWVLRHYAVAYPGAAAALKGVLEAWRGGDIRLFTVPFHALNAEGGAPQYFALGVGAMPEGARGAKDAASVRPHLDVYVALGPSSSSSSGATQKKDAPKRRAKDKGAAGEGDGEVDEEVLRLAEALLHEGLEDLAKRAVADTGHSLAHLDACLGELALTAFRALQQLQGRSTQPLLPARLTAELSSLTPPILDGVGRRTATSGLCAALRELCWMPLAGSGAGTLQALAPRRMPDQAPPADVLSGVDARLVNDAWDYMSPAARVLLLHVTAAATSNAMAHLRGKPRNTCTRVNAIPQVVLCSLNLLGATETQQLGQQVTLAPTPITALNARHQQAMVQAMARVQLLAGLAMVVHEVVAQGSSTAWAPGKTWATRLARWEQQQVLMAAAAAQALANATAAAGGPPGQAGPPPAAQNGLPPPAAMAQHAGNGVARAGSGGGGSGGGVAPAELMGRLQHLEEERAAALNGAAPAAGGGSSDDRGSFGGGTGTLTRQALAALQSRSHPTTMDESDYAVADSGQVLDSPFSSRNSSFSSAAATALALESIASEAFDVSADYALIQSFGTNITPMDSLDPYDEGMVPVPPGSQIEAGLLRQQYAAGPRAAPGGTTQHLLSTGQSEEWNAHGRLAAVVEESGEVVLSDGKTASSWATSMGVTVGTSALHTTEETSVMATGGATTSRNMLSDTGGLPPRPTRAPAGLSSLSGGSPLGPAGRGAGPAFGSVTINSYEARGRRADSLASSFDGHTATSHTQLPSSRPSTTSGTATGTGTGTGTGSQSQPTTTTSASTPSASTAGGLPPPGPAPGRGAGAGRPPVAPGSAGRGGQQRSRVQQGRFRQMYYSKVEAVADEVHRMEVRTATATAVPGGLRAVGRRLLSPPAATAQQNQQDDWDEVALPPQGGAATNTASSGPRVAGPVPVPAGGGVKADGANGVAPCMVALEVDAAPQQQQQQQQQQQVKGAAVATNGPTANGTSPHQLTACGGTKQDAASEGKASSAAGEAPQAGLPAADPDSSKDTGGAGPGTRTLAELREEAWQAVPLHRRVAYHLHMGVRILWLALMGDPSFYQDAMDLLGEPPGRGGPGWRRGLALVGYWVRRSLLLLLSLVAGLSQWLGLQVCRWTLWWWPGAAEVLLAAGRHRPALSGISIYSATNRLHRSLVIDRENMYSRFYVPLGVCIASQPPPPPSKPKAQEGAKKEEGGKDTAGSGRDGSGGGAAGGDAPEITELYLARLAGCHLLRQLGLPQGRLVLTEVLIGVSENLDASKSVATTAYLLPGRTQAAAMGRGGWLPLWQLNRQAHGFSVWDYSEGTAGQSGPGSWLGPACKVITATPSEADKGATLACLQGQLLALGAREGPVGQGQLPPPRQQPPQPDVVQAAAYDSAGCCRRLTLARSKREATPLDHTLQPIREEEAEWSAAQSSKAAEGAGQGGEAPNAALALPEVVARSVKRLALGVFHADHLPTETAQQPEAGGRVGRRQRRAAAVKAPVPGVQYLQGSLMLQPQELTLPAGPGALTLLCTEAGLQAALGAAASAVPAWVTSQLQLAAAAAADSSRHLPPAAALLRVEATGEEWLVAHDVLASASVAANTHTLWPLQPQGVRCWHRKARSRASAAASTLLPMVAPQEHVEDFALTATAPRSGTTLTASSHRSLEQDHLDSPVRTMASNLQQVVVDDWAEADGDAGGGGGYGGATHQQQHTATETHHSGSSFVAAVVPVSQAAVAWKAAAAPPEWLAPLLGVVAVQWAPCKATATWQLPKELLLVRGGSPQREGSLQMHYAGGGPDSGTSRALLWWLWNQGPGGCQKAMAPGKEVALPPDMARDAWRPGLLHDAKESLKDLGRLGAAAGSKLVACITCKGSDASEGGGEAAGKDKKAPLPPKPRYVPVLDGLFCTITEELLLQAEPALRSYWRAYAGLSASGCAKVLDPAGVPLLQYCLGTGVLSNTPGQHSHLAHSLETLSTANSVPGNSYAYYNPLAGVPEAAAAASAEAAAAEAAGVGPVGAAGGRAATQVAAALAPLRAVAMDSGTWPMDGGGVATCREQVVQGTDDISWHGEAEVAHDLKQIIPKMRAQPHVTQVSLCLQWDTQHDSPNQSTFVAVPYTQLTQRSYATTPAVVARRFLPLWRCLLQSLRKANNTSESADIRAMADAFIGMYEYFQTYDWDFTFADPQVSEVFAFEFHVLAASLPNTCTNRQGLGGPAPAQEELSALFDLFQHYLKTLCVTLPNDVTVTQASHHGLQAIAGLIAQLRTNQSLQVWDHGILMRERMIYLDCFKRNLLPHFVNEQLVRLHRAAAMVLYRLTDLVVPCNASFNTLWELWLGTDRHRLMPLLNALEIEHYPSLQEHEAPQPTAAMLSHVYALKDIMSAIRAAAIIVHDYGVTEYKLEVYGSLDFDKDYVVGCQQLIKELRLENNVALRGLGSPTKVLAMTWIYIQTSISEGLPVSVIEAGLTGKCVICTNVGGCAELLANPNAGAPGTAMGLSGPQPPMFGRLVAPKDVAMIAYAQLEVLGFLPSLQIPKLLKPPEVDVEELKRRIHDPEVRAQRHALGRLFRQFGLDQFRMSRYILQHRQALYTAHYKREGAAAAAAAQAAREAAAAKATAAALKAAGVEVAGGKEVV